MIETAKEFMNRFTPGTMGDLSNFQNVLAIIRDVQERGDAALADYSRRFDKVAPQSLEVPKDTIRAAWDNLAPELKAALNFASDRIRTYQSSIKWQAKEEGELFQKIHPLKRVGIYVPGGKASYPSSVLHTAVLAKTAGVEEVILVTPPQADGISQTVLAACYLTGVSQVFQVGGAQAVAALAYGTETIPRVDKIVGPGNQYVALAKKLVYGDVGIDSIAGPSEIIVVIDETADPESVALDLMAQAEHDEMARTFLVSADEKALKRVEAEVARIKGSQSRIAIIEESLANHHYAILTSGKAENAQVVNFIAGEHVSIQTKDARDYIDLVYSAGALFIGAFAPEAIGDYSAGPSHVLPTGGNARYASGLSVNDFLRTNSVLCVSEDSFRSAAPSAMALAREESLMAHHDSVKIRLRKENKR